MYFFSWKITPRHFRRWGGKLPTQEKKKKKREIKKGQENLKTSIEL